MTTPARPTVEIPRVDGETPRAYAARVAYLTMGPARSLDRVRQSIGMRSVRRLEEWSADGGWVEHARRYDETLATLAAQEHAQQYRAELEAHRGRAAKAGLALYGVATSMLGELRAAPVEYTPAALSTIARALQVALDLEAHALRLSELLPRLDDTPEGE